jgi:predicted nucleic acid-binding protein
VIALDSSSLIAYLGGDRGSDVDAVGLALEEHQGVLPPVVLSELLSDPRLPGDVRELLLQLPLLDITEGYWERSGSLRSRILSRRHRAPLADTLIAQSCLDHDVPLVTRDADFGAFARVAGLRLLSSGARR